MWARYTFLFLSFWVSCQCLIAQDTVWARIVPDTIPWQNREKTPALWNDWYESNLVLGFGENPLNNPVRKQFGDYFYYNRNGGLEGFVIEARSLRISTGRWTNPPDTAFFSENLSVLAGVETEYYHGANTLAAAQDTANYDFEYLDRVIQKAKQIGSPYLEMAYMPVTLSSGQQPGYRAGVPQQHLISWDNGVRNAPPADPVVFGRVQYEVVKYASERHGIQHFEFWNEPDQALADSGYFWKGSAMELYQAYSAWAENVEKDSLLGPNVKIGCCGFLFQSSQNQFADSFLSQVAINGDRLDFLSFHPISNTAGGYDSSLVTVAEGLRDAYAPNAELHVTNWGSRSATLHADSAASFRYGIEQWRAIRDMVKRGIRFAHRGPLFDTDSAASVAGAPGYISVPGHLARLPYLFSQSFYYSEFDEFDLAEVTSDPAAEIIWIRMGNSWNLWRASTYRMIILEPDRAGQSSLFYHIENNDLPGGFPVWNYTEFGFGPHLTVDDFGYAGFDDPLTVFSPPRGQNGKIILGILDGVLSNDPTKVQPSSMQILPNPGTGLFTFSVEETAYSGPYQIEVSNMQGKTVMRSSVNEMPHRLQMEVPDGLYLVRVSSRNQVFVGRLIMQR